MKITVCQLNANQNVLGNEWGNLIRHCQSKKSDLVLLPEMPFVPWFTASQQVQQQVWDDAVKRHKLWIQKFHDLKAQMVIASRPISTLAGKHYNMGFIWMAESGFQDVHSKVYLPDEPGFWEATWYDRGPKDFTSIDINGIKFGFTICTELWFMEHAREYSEQGIHFLVCPRATEARTLEKWIHGGQTAAVISGAYCLSSNHFGHSLGTDLGGIGWIIDPDGKVLAKTSVAEPFVTLDIDLSVADQAKQTYPRYVKR